MAEHSATKAVVKYLAEHLKKSMPSIVEVKTNFPAAGEALNFPALTVFVRTPQLRMTAPYTITKTSPGDDLTTTVARCIGYYDFTLQIDMWASNKPTREKLQEELISVFNPTIDTCGLALLMTDYYEQYCAYSLGDDLEFVEDEESSQRGEWRIRATVLANCRAVKEHLAYVMETIENNIEVLDTEVEALADPDYSAPV